MTEQFANTISQIEDGIINLIKSAQEADALGYKLKKIDTYGGDFSDGVEQMVRNFPAVLVIFAGATRISKTNNRTKFSARYGLICCAKNLRSEQSARSGDSSKVGSYKIVLDMAMLLMGQTFGLDIDPIVIEGFDPLSNDKADRQLASIYGLNITTTFEIEGGVDPATLADFKTFHANWDLPPHADIETPLPADDEADATDHITLETDNG